MLPAGLVERFQPERVLGEGAFGRVVLVRQAGGEPAAVKLLSREVFESRDLMARFRREAEVGVRLESPFIAAVLDSGVAGEVPWIAFEFVPGETLQEVLARVGRLSLEEVHERSRSIDGCA